jgi:hypothetical protein
MAEEQQMEIEVEAPEIEIIDDTPAEDRGKPLRVRSMSPMTRFPSIRKTSKRGLRICAVLTTTSGGSRIRLCGNSKRLLPTQSP